MRAVKYWWPAGAWAAIIWVASTDAFSAQRTSLILWPMLKWLFPDTPEATLWLVHHSIRKAAHVGEYCVLSLLVLRGVRGEQRGWRWTWALATVAIAANYAALDEVHQLFVATREAAVTDVLLDTFGAALGQAAVWWWERKGPGARNQGLGKTGNTADKDS